MAFGAGGTVVAALVIGLGLSTLLFLKERATRQRAETAEQEQARQRQKAEAEGMKARSEAAKSQQVARLLQDMLQSVGPSVAQGRDTTMLQEILDSTTQRVGNDLTNQPEVEAELRTTIGLVYQELRQWDKAEGELRKALALRRKLPDGDLGVAVSLRNLASFFLQGAKDSEARAMLEEALAINRKLLGDENIEVANCFAELLDIVSETGTRAEAEAMALQLLATQRRLLGPEHKNVVRSLEILTGVYATKGDLAKAEETQREVLALYRKVFGEGHPDTARQFNRWAPEDIAAGSRLADMGIRLHKGDLRLFTYQNCKALAEYRQGRFASAAEWASKALSQPQYDMPNEIRVNCRRIQANMLLAMSRHQLRQPDKARAALARGLEIADTKLPKIESGDLGPYWPDWVFADMLMHEARALIEGSLKPATN